MLLTEQAMTNVRKGAGDDKRWEGNMSIQDSKISAVVLQFIDNVQRAIRSAWCCRGSHSPLPLGVSRPMS
jgi:hypothetical protein